MLAGHKDLMGGRVELDRTDLQDFVGGCHPTSSQNSADSSHQLTGAEGLGDVVVATELQAEDSIDFVILSGHKQNGGPIPLGPQLPTNVCTAHARQANIQNHCHGASLSNAIQRLCAIIFNLNPKAITG
ncbi:unannotated protein [freshwater metagenome]|uniref:Unannotated protein n=1 Tax=freshwater metagenome TaxID=449393 RepID=A0A6J6HWZ9_9ZZZZ